MKYAREIKVGVLATICLFLLFFGFNFLKGVNIFHPTNSYTGVYDNIHGLKEQGAVYIRGYKVGQVDEIDYDFTKDSSFVVNISINRDIKLPVGTQMALVSDGLLGGMAIELLLPDSLTGEYCESKVQLPTIYKAGLVESLQMGLLASVDDAIQNIDSLVKNVKQQLDNDHLANTLENVDKISGDLTVVSSDVKGMMKNKVPGIVNNLDSAVSNIQTISYDLNQANLKGTVARLDSTIDNVNGAVADIRSDRGTIGQLINNDTLYQNINSTVISADSLLKDLKANPKRYVHFSVFGSSKK